MSKILDIVAWTGALLLGLCAVPELIHSIEKGTNDSSWAFLTMWIGGELCLLIYVLPKKEYPLIFNYLFNILLISGLIYYKLA
jgi:hypothetical protein